MNDDILCSVGAMLNSANGKSLSPIWVLTTGPLP
jgi:hypothetical protein